jgi:vitamin B12 transporter
MKIYSVKLCAAVAALSVAAVPVLADEQVREPEEMVVSASRTAMDLTKVASSVTIIDREYLDQRQSVYIADVLRDVPGLTVNRSGSAGGLTEVRSRGGEANQLLVLIDGVRANDPANQDQFQWQSLTSYDVDRIEVVRGPQSAVWGSDANSGVINIITRKEKGEVAGGGFVEGGSYDSLAGGLRVGGSGEKFSWGVNGSYVEQDAFNYAQEGDEDDPFSNKTAGMNLGYRFSDTTGIDFVGRYTESDTRTDFETCTPTPCIARVTDSIPDRTLIDQLVTGLTGRTGFIDNRWTHELSLLGTQTESSFLSAFPEFATEGALTELRYQTNWDFARGGVARGTDLVTFAIDHQKRDYKDSGDIDVDYKQTGYIVEGRSMVTDALALTGSVRYDNNSDYKNVATWRVTSGYDFFTTGTRVRGAAGTGQKAPTMTELYGYFPGFTGNSDLQPEKSEGWEIGADQSFAGDAYRISLTYFNERLKDQITGAGATAVNSSETTKRKGVEIGMRGQFTENFAGKLSYTYLDTDAIDVAGASPDARASEVRRPRNTAAVNLNYRLLRQRANVNLNVSYTDKQYDYTFELPTYANFRTELDDFTLVDLAGEFKATDEVTLYGRIDNLFDEDYETVYSYNTMGRAAFAGVRVSLGR